jgi:hypothetical protein
MKQSTVREMVNLGCFFVGVLVGIAATMLLIAFYQLTQ